MYVSCHWLYKAPVFAYFLPCSAIFDTDLGAKQRSPERLLILITLFTTSHFSASQREMVMLLFTFTKLTSLLCWFEVAWTDHVSLSSLPDSAANKCQCVHAGQESTYFVAPSLQRGQHAFRSGRVCSLLPTHCLVARHCISTSSVLEVVGVAADGDFVYWENWSRPQSHTAFPFCVDFVMLSTDYCFFAPQNYCTLHFLTSVLEFLVLSSKLVLTDSLCSKLRRSFIHRFVAPFVMSFYHS